MKTRKTHARNRNFKNEKSLWNPIFLQLKFAIDTIEKYFDELPKDKKLKIYDFGCGQKPYECFVQNHEYIGIDIDEENIKADIFADISKVPLDSNIADIVTSFYVLEHVENPQDVINEKYRILKEGGELFMLVPLYWEEHEQPHDYFRFTRYAIKYLMQKSGFKNIEIIAINTNYSILGMHLARFFNRRFFSIFVPAINLFFYKMEIKALKYAKRNGIDLSNVMTFAVKGNK